MWLTQKYVMVGGETRQQMMMLRRRRTARYCNGILQAVRVRRRQAKAKAPIRAASYPASSLFPPPPLSRRRRLHSPKCGKIGEKLRPESAFASTD